jgi:tetratricopeptide (TPR) repeat protein
MAGSPLKRARRGCGSAPRPRHRPRYGEAPGYGGGGLNSSGCHAPQTQAPRKRQASLPLPHGTGRAWAGGGGGLNFARFPSDYRPYVLRGLYFRFFTNFTDDETLRKRALDEFRKAAEEKPDSALPHYFAASAILKWSFFKQANMSDQQRQAFYRAPLDELDKALMLNTKLLPALRDRASIYLHLNQFRNAIQDYNRYLEVDPDDAGALDGRGHAELELGKTREAIDELREDNKSAERVGRRRVRD